MQNNMYGAVQPSFDQLNMQRTPSMDSTNTFDSFMAPPPTMMAPGMNQQNLQYQQMLANATRQNQYYSQMGGAYGQQAQNMDQYRNMQSTPLQAQGMSNSPMTPNGYGQMMGQQMYGQQQQYPMGYGQMPAQSMQVGAGRRGRVSEDSHLL
jgi:protein JSN1